MLANNINIAIPNTKVSIKDSDSSMYKEYRLDLKPKVQLYSFHDKKVMLELKIIEKSLVVSNILLTFAEQLRKGDGFRKFPLLGMLL